MKNLKLYFVSLIIFFSYFSTMGQGKEDDKQKSPIDTALNGFQFRSIGPAFMSGRISDIAIDPNNENIWYVAVSSGGTWKTENAGTTWQPLTDNQPFFATGCITIDPNNSASIWLGTGENVGGRHIGIGHGIYHSLDGGKSWKDMGLKKSEHLSKIIIHPDNSDIIWVASQGPLWSSGGDRGLFKSTDGGKTWKNNLEINEWTGVTDLVIDPTNPDILYAASWQRHRNVAGLIDGGPGTALYKSTDGGDNWFKINKGLPRSNMGKIGLAISPINPTVLYVAIELDRRQGAVYRTSNSGGSWSKMSNTVSGGTGPHYYQELVASPHEFDKIYLMNVRVLVSDDGGKNFYQMKESQKHSDNHSLTFKEDDPNYMLIGTDGGIYESFDNSKNWKYVSNLPLTQFYKLAVDDAEPFYNIYGGTQDNNTQGGPSRTFKRNGISNDDWYVVLGGDGHQPATEPGNPDIMYAQSQQGYINRIDRTTGEAVNIRPHEGIDEPYERFNWDAPILVSQHDPKRLYFGTQRVWRSENRGDSWSTISSDLTKNEERLSLPIMGRVQSFDNALDVYAMSTYNTITSLSESKTNENVLYAGTDDGIIQYTRDGGDNWSKMTVDELPDVPASAFVNDIKVDLHDDNVAYVALDNHKFGDYSPYLYKTTNGGKKWKSIVNGIPDGTLVWRLVQDHVNPNLLFLGTEYGVYVSLNQGDKWHKFSNGLPTISIRDLAIQKRENDLVLATFGRSFYVLDDYSPLREMTEDNLSKEAFLFPTRKALQYNQIMGGSGSSGGSTYVAKNPNYGATITYHLSETSHVSLKYKRQKMERKLKNSDIPFPGWEALDKEIVEPKSEAILMITDNSGNIVDQISGPLRKGTHRVTWGLRTSKATTVNVTSGSANRQRWGRSRGIMTNVNPGTYSATLYKRVGGDLTKLSDPVSITVERIRENVLKNPNADKHEQYNIALAELTTLINKSSHVFMKAMSRVATYERNLNQVKTNKEELTKAVYLLRDKMNVLDREFSGSAAKAEIGEKDRLNIMDRLMKARGGWYPNSYGPTELHMQSFEIAKQMYERSKPKIDGFVEEVRKLGKLLEDAGGPIYLD
ncbi:glycosyl hydrolase [Flavobacteriaceae bacterium]|nr:glycosyl hydrolase [Flavobacteriaceae bacterium]